MLRFVLQTGLVAYPAILGALYFGQRRLLYHPGRGRPQLGGLAHRGVREVRLHTADGLSLLSWYLPPPAGAPVVLYLHGNGGHIGYRAERMLHFAGAGFGVLMVEYRGYGGNPGRPTEDGLDADGRAALTFLEAEGITADRRVLYGESLGSGVAVRLAAAHDVAALILESPFTSIAEVAQYHYPFVPARRLTRDRFDALAVIGRVKAPILFLQAEDDRVVPVRFGRALYAAAPQPKEVWTTPQGGHNHVGGNGGIAATIAFVRRRLDGARTLGHAAQ
jgi:uncharacterized protein